MSMRSCFNIVYPSHGDFPVETGIIDQLINFAKQIRDGKVEGQKAPFETPAKLYDMGAVKFLYE